MINEYTCSDTMEIQTANLKQDLGSGNTVIWSLQFRVLETAFRTAQNVHAYYPIL